MEGNTYVTNVSGPKGGGWSGVPIRDLKQRGGGSENITKKMNLRPFKLYRINLEPPNSSNKEVFHY